MRGLFTDRLFATLAWRRVGIIGTVIAALCCFTPVLVILFGAIGLSWLVGYLDYVLLPGICFQYHPKERCWRFIQPALSLIRGAG